MRGTVRAVPRPACVAAVAVLALATAGCGGSTGGADQTGGGNGGEAGSAASPGGVPAVTTPGTGVPYEVGGGDGSGADGSDDVRARGGVAAAPDSDGADGLTGAGG